MLHSISSEDLERILKKEHPCWTSEAIRSQAADIIDSWDDALDPLLSGYMRNGYESDFRYGDCSLNKIRAFRPGCSYLEALSIMDTYIKNPSEGRALILKR